MLTAGKILVLACDGKVYLYAREMPAQKEREEAPQVQGQEVLALDARAQAPAAAPG
jgi:hypothetical protein